MEGNECSLYCLYSFAQQNIECKKSIRKVQDKSLNTFAMCFNLVLRYYSSHLFLLGTTVCKNNTN